MKGLVELLSRGLVWYNIAGDDPRSAIENAMDPLSTVPGLFDSGVQGARELSAAILEREALASTAMGGGLAFPHPRAPFFSRPEDAFIALFYPRFPVQWNAPDSVPVKSFFVLVSSNAKDHLSTLSALSKRCQDEAFLALIEDQAGLAELEAYLKSVS